MSRSRWYELTLQYYVLVTELELLIWQRWITARIMLKTVYSRQASRRRLLAPACLRLFVAFLAAFVAGCGLVIDDEKRLARAQEALAGGDSAAAIIDAKALLESDPKNLAARLLLADASFISQDFESAAFEYTRLVELGAPLSQVAMNWSAALLALGRYEELLNFIPLEPNYEADLAREIRLSRAAAAQAVGRLGEARGLYEEVLAAYPDNQKANVGVAYTYYQEGNVQEAKRLIAAQTRERPDWDLAQLLAAEIASDEGDYKRAIAVLEPLLDSPAVAADKGMGVRVYASLGSVSLAEGDLDRASAAIGELAKLAPKSFYAMYLQAELDLARGNLPAALGRTDELLAISANNISVLLLSARVRLAQGSLAQAEAHLVRAFNLEPDNEGVRRLLADVRLRQGRNDDAANLIEPLLGVGEPDVGLMQLALRIAVAQGDRAGGISSYVDALADNPDDPQLRLGLAASQLALGDVDAAESTMGGFEDGVELGWRGPLLAGMAAVSRGDTAGAIAEAERMAAQWPELADVQRASGALAEAAGRTDIAAERFRRSIELAPQNERSYLDLARVQMAVGELAAARETVADGNARIPKSVTLLMAMANIDTRSADDPAAALRWLEAARNADASAFAPRLALAEYYRVAADLPTALAFAREAVELEPNNALAQYSFGSISLAQGDLPAATEALSEAANLRPDATAFRYRLAQAHLAAGDGASALRALAPIKDASTEVSLLRGYAELANNDVLSATAIGQRLLRASPNSAGPLDLLGQIALATGDFKTAADYLTRAYEAAPSNEALTKATFARLRVQDNGDDADALLVAQLAATPDDTDLRRTYADLLASTGRAEESVRHYEQVLSERKDDFVALNNLAWIYATQGDERAEELARRAVTIAPDSPQANDTLGWILTENGKYTEAISRLRHALSQGAQDPEIRYHLAVALQHSGDSRSARAQLQSALQSELPFAERSSAERLLRELARQ